MSCALASLRLFFHFGHFQNLVESKSCIVFSEIVSSVDSDDDLEMGSPAPDLQGFSIKEQIKIVCAGDTGS